MQRTILCKESGVSFPYSGRGRPPIYCQEVSARKIMERQRNASKRFQERKRAEKKAAKRVNIEKGAKNVKKAASGSNKNA